MLRWTYTLTAAAALVGAGIVHGFWTNRWAEDTAAREAADRLTAIPLRIGDWEGTDLESNPAPGVAGSLQRKYLNRRLGVTVNIALVTGKPGPVATHTPEVCYGAAGYAVGKREPVRLDAGGSRGVFWTADAVKASQTEESRLRLFWAWNPGSGWVASDDARREFPRLRYPVLHKLYVIRNLAPGEAGTPGKDEACVKFLAALLPELEKCLFPKES